MYEMEHFLKCVHNINWTVVRPPRLQNALATAKEFLDRRGLLCPRLGTLLDATLLPGAMLPTSCCRCWTPTPGYRGVAMTTK
ncbi:hypothetical protein AALO_G00078750 [Alosa alosa]|uniref:Uncharacterized protein n=1 Tax=Alosa alosa TaxID=278164 RepID=A0AAV6GWM9_9TELE|nr:hypothetical protein AALO_G00078750 [Alosa alosa]